MRFHAISQKCERGSMKKGAIKFIRDCDRGDMRSLRDKLRGNMGRGFVLLWSHKTSPHGTSPVKDIKKLNIRNT